jgi:hypothetical protein
MQWLERSRRHLVAAAPNRRLTRSAPSRAIKADVPPRDAPRMPLKSRRRRCRTRREGFSQGRLYRAGRRRRARPHEVLVSSDDDASFWARENPACTLDGVRTWTSSVCLWQPTRPRAMRRMSERSAFCLIRSPGIWPREVSALDEPGGVRTPPRTAIPLTTAMGSATRATSHCDVLAIRPKALTAVGCVR